MPREQFPVPDEADKDLANYFLFAATRMRRYYRLLPALLAIFLVMDIIYAHIARPVFTAVAALTPPRDSLNGSNNLPSGGLASVTRQLGLGGFSSNNAELYDEYTRVLKSYRLAGVLAAKPSFLHLAFPGRWDPSTGHLRHPTGWVSDLATDVKAFLGLSTTRATDEDQVYQFLERQLSISIPHDPTTNISEMSLRFVDGPSAERILSIIIDQADELVRADTRRDIGARIAYLRDQLRKATLDDQRNALITLLTTQMNAMMIISADQHYATYVVEPPHAPAKPSWPTLSSIIGLTLFLGLVTWMAIILFLPEENRFMQRFSRPLLVGLRVPTYRP